MAFRSASVARLVRSDRPTTNRSNATPHDTRTDENNRHHAHGCGCSGGVGCRHLDGNPVGVDADSGELRSDVFAGRIERRLPRVEAA